MRNSFIFSSKENRRFFLKALALFLGVLVFCFVVVPPQYEQAYAGALIDKVARLKSLEGPKIVLIGNSNLAFGMQSEKVEQAFGMPVVNMGYDGALGNAFHENMARLNVVPGDIYIVCHSSYAKEGKNSMADLIATLENRWELWPICFDDVWTWEDAKLLADMFRAYPTYLRGCMNQIIKKVVHDSSGVYERRAFNVYGDIAEGKPNSIYASEEIFKGEAGLPVDAEVLARMNELNRWLQERGATMLVAAYPIAWGKYSPPLTEYEEAQKKLEAGLDCPVISDFTQYLFDYSEFFDAAVHLTDEGAQRRTELLIGDLRRWMDAQQTADAR